MVDGFFFYLALGKTYCTVRSLMVQMYLALPVERLKRMPVVSRADLRSGCWNAPAVEGGGGVAEGIVDSGVEREGEVSQ